RSNLVVLNTTISNNLQGGVSSVGAVRTHLQGCTISENGYNAGGGDYTGSGIWAVGNFSNGSNFEPTLRLNNNTIDANGLGRIKCYNAGIREFYNNELIASTQDGPNQTGLSLSTFSSVLDYRRISQASNSFYDFDYSMIFYDRSSSILGF